MGKINFIVTNSHGEKIGILRAYLKLSQAAFARPLQLSPTHIARYEKGISKPTEAIVNQICNIYDVDPRFFSEGIPIQDAVIIKNPEAGIPERMKAARQAKGWSQYRLAKESGVGQAVINKVEFGAKLTSKQGLKVAEALEVGFDWLMTGDENKKWYPADRKMIDWLWEHEDARKDVWEKMKQSAE